MTASGRDLRASAREPCSGARVAALLDCAASCSPAGPLPELSPCLRAYVLMYVSGSTASEISEPEQGTHLHIAAWPLTWCLHGASLGQHSSQQAKKL